MSIADERERMVLYPPSPASGRQVLVAFGVDRVNGLLIRDASGVSRGAFVLDLGFAIA